MADDKKKPEDEEEALESPAEETAEHESGAEPPDENPEQAGSEEAKISYAITDVLVALTAFDVVLPADTNLENFIDRLYTALLTVKAQSGVDETDKVPEQQSPMIATMSSQISALQNRIINGERQAKRDALQSLLKSGRCTPAEHAAQLRALGSVKMSLLDDSTVSAGEFDV